MANVADLHSTLPELAPYVPVPLYLQAASLARSTWVTFVTDNPFRWFWQQGRRNAQADMEGPLYVIGAPDRQFDDGKAVLATSETLEKCAPFLVSLIIRTPEGEPIPHTRVEWWQAKNDGTYAYSSYYLRGNFLTDADGRVEVLTIAPGSYGPASHARAGHFHLMIDGGEKYEQLTTQLYVCDGNNKEGMNTDFLNYMRAPRYGNMLQAWCIPANNDGKKYKDFPELTGDIDTEKRVEWWNAKLEGRVPGKNPKVVAGASTVISLNHRPNFFGF